MMKRIGYLFAAVLAVAFIGACSDEDSDSTPSSSSTTSSITSAPASSAPHHQTQPTSPSPGLPGGETHPSHGAKSSPQQSPAPGLPGSDTSNCDGSICHNPNYGGGPNPDENGGAVMPNPNGDGSQVPCEGTICTNPNHGAGG